MWYGHKTVLQMKANVIHTGVGFGSGTKTNSLLQQSLSEQYSGCLLVWSCKVYHAPPDHKVSR